MENGSSTANFGYAALPRRGVRAISCCRKRTPANLNASEMDALLGSRKREREEEEEEEPRAAPPAEQPSDEMDAALAL